MDKKDIQILDIISLRGPNTWTYRPVLEALVDIGELEDFPSNTLPGFVDRLKAWLPGLYEHRCSYGEPGGFLKRLDEGTWPAHIMEHVALELQNLAGMPGGFGRARETSTRGVYKVVVRAWHDEVTTLAIHTARDLVMAAINDKPFDVAARVEALRDLAERRLLGPSTACIVDAATDKARGIPAIRLSEGNLVQLGYGVRQRRIWTAETDRTSAIAESISRDKDLTKSLLASCGVPVPEGRLVDSAADAWDAAEDIGLPVVVKPYDGNHGRGVFTNLNSRAEVESAYAGALEEGNGVIVERYILGEEHRLLVVGGKLVAAASGEIASVTGDGKSTIRQLIESQINSDPRRGEAEEFPLDVINLDNNAVARLEIERQGFNGESVPPVGKEVMILRTGNMSRDVTGNVHPDVAAAASLAARVVGLDIAGIDLVTRDISQPLESQGGAIVEVNAGPGLLMHLKPAQGEARPVGQAIVDHLFPNGDNGRIPVVGVSGSFGKTTVARVLSRILDIHGLRTGLVCSSGLYLDERLVEAGDRAHWNAARRVLMNRTIDAAVIENSSDVILGQGLAYDRCQVGIVTNIHPEHHFGAFDVHTPEKVFNALRTQIDVVLPQGSAVINANDAYASQLAELSDGDVIYFLQAMGKEGDALVTSHVANGKRAVVFENQKIALVQGTERQLVVTESDLPNFNNSTRSHQLDNLLAAVAAAWALGVPAELIGIALKTQPALGQAA